MRVGVRVGWFGALVLGVLAVFLIYAFVIFIVIGAAVGVTILLGYHAIGWAAGQFRRWRVWRNRPVYPPRHAAIRQ